MTEGPEPIPATAAILAGGRSSRFGANKALAPYEGRPMVARVADALRPRFARTILVANDSEPYAFLGLPTYADVKPGLGPLGGILTALRVSPFPWVFAAACDMPLLDGAFAQAIAAAGREEDLAVVPRVGGRLHPLHAAYAVALAETIELRRIAGDLALHRLLESVPIRALDEERIRAWGFDPASLANANTPEELEALRRRP